MSGLEQFVDKLLRITKLAAGVSHVLNELIRNKDKIREADYWIAELTDVSRRLWAHEDQQRVAKEHRVDFDPEIELGRKRWLAVYNANNSMYSAGAASGSTLIARRAHSIDVSGSPRSA